MSLTYKLVVDSDALHSLLGCRPVERQRLVGFLESLAVDPFQRGDCELRSDNRNYQVKFLQPFKITFWVDHAAKELRVVDIQNLRV